MNNIINDLSHHIFKIDVLKLLEQWNTKTVLIILSILVVAMLGSFLYVGFENADTNREKIVILIVAIFVLVVYYVCGIPLISNTIPASNYLPAIILGVSIFAIMVLIWIQYKKFNLNVLIATLIFAILVLFVLSLFTIPSNKAETKPEDYTPNEIQNTIEGFQ